MKKKQKQPNYLLEGNVNGNITIFLNNIYEKWMLQIKIFKL